MRSKSQTKKSMIKSSFLLQNQAILDEIAKPIETQTRQPENIQQEINAIKSHQRAHDDLLRDLTMQIAQTNVTVFRQKVAENFTNLKEGFILIQKERRVEKESHKSFQKQTLQQIKDFQQDFMNFAKILQNFEDRIQTAEKNQLKKQLQQQSQIAVLKQVLKRSGVYNHYLMQDIELKTKDPQNKTTKTDSIQLDSLQKFVVEQLEKYELLNEQKYDSINTLISQNETLTKDLVEQKLHQVQQSVQASVDRHSSKIAEFESLISKNFDTQLQKFESWKTKIDLLQNQQIFDEELEKQNILRIEADLQKVITFNNQTKIKQEQSDFEIFQFKEKTNKLGSLLEENQSDFAKFKMGYDQFIQQSKIQSYYVRVDDVCDNQEKILLKIEQNENLTLEINQQYKECFDELQKVVLTTKQSNFEASQVLAKQIQQYQEIKLKMQDYSEKMNIQTVNDIIQQKVELDTLQFQGTLNKLNSQILALDQKIIDQQATMTHEKHQTTELINTILNQPATIDELADYNLDDLSQIEPAKKPKKQKFDSGRQLMLQQQLFRKTKDEVQQVFDEVTKIKQKQQKFTEKLSNITQQTQEKHEFFESNFEKVNQKFIVIDQKLTTVNESQTLLKQAQTAFRENFRNELENLNSVQKKFKIIEISQKEIIEKFFEFSSKSVDQNRNFQVSIENKLEKNIEKTVEITDSFSEFSVKFDILQGKMAKYVDITEEIYLNKGNILQQIDKMVKNGDQMQGELIDARQSISSLIDCTTKLRFEQTKDQGRVENVVQDLILMKQNSEKQKGFIYKLQDETVIQERKIGILRSGMQEIKNNLDEMQNLKRMDMRVEETVAVADNIVEKQSLALQDLRSQFQGVKTNIFGKDRE